MMTEALFPQGAKTIVNTHISGLQYDASTDVRPNGDTIFFWSSVDNSTPARLGSSIYKVEHDSYLGEQAFSAEGELMRQPFVLLLQDGDL